MLLNCENEITILYERKRELQTLLPYSVISLSTVTTVSAVVSMAIVIAITISPNNIHAMAKIRPL